MWLAVSLLLSGCASNNKQLQLLVYGEIRLTPEMKNIGLGVVRPTPPFTLEQPSGKESGAFDITADAAQGDAAVLGPVFFALGSAASLTLGLSEQERLAASRSINAVAHDYPLDEQIAQAITRNVQRTQARQIHRLQDSILMKQTLPKDRLGHVVMDEAEWIEDLPRILPRLNLPYDTVILLRVRFQGFRTIPNEKEGWTTLFDPINPHMALVLQVYVTAVRTNNGTELGGLTIYYESDPQRFKDWTAHHAQSLRRAFETGLSEINAGIESQLIIIPSQ